MKKSAMIPMACVTTLLGMQQLGHAAELIYGFNDPAISGFTGNGATALQSTSTGVTEGTGALNIQTTRTQTYGGAITATVPADFYNATSFDVDVTITSVPTDSSGNAVYFDLVPVFFSTDGEIDPDTSNAANFINLGGRAPGLYHFTLNLVGYFDPQGILSADATPGAILAADSAFDAAKPTPTTDAITGFQLTSEHGVLAGGQSANIYVDNVTVPVPEPTSFGLLAGLGLLARRRR